jgi:hypothetical protein
MKEMFSLFLRRRRPSSTNGTRYNAKKIKWLVKAIETRVLEEMGDLSKGSIPSLFRLKTPVEPKER